MDGIVNSLEGGTTALFYYANHTKKNISISAMRGSFAFNRE